MLSFEDACLEATKRFVQTAVVIDDEAEFCAVKEKEDALFTPLITPPLGITIPPDPDPIKQVENYITDEAESVHKLSVDSVVNGFAELKITCSVQLSAFGDDADENNKIIERYINCAEHSDIAIVDWRLFKKDMGLAGDIIINLLRKDQEVGGKVRLICVYTTMPNPGNILKDIKDRIVDELNLQVTGNRKDLAYTIDDKVRVVIFNKSASKIAGSNDANVVSFEKLPEAVLKEFSTLVRGLIPCATLHSIAAVREQTYSLLAIMNKNLDGAFCAHRALIPDTDDSIDFILDLIAQEVSTKIISDRLARNALSTQSLKKWYDGNSLPKNKYPLEKEVLWECIEKGGINLFKIRKLRAKGWLKEKQKSKNELKDKSGKKISYAKAGALIEKGLFPEIVNCSPPSEQKPFKFAEMLYSVKTESEKACEELSRLTCSSKDASDLRKNTINGLFLTLGSVLQVRGEESDYWLCLQPPCDSVRLEDKTDFLFLQLYKGNEGNADLIIKLHDGTYIPLSIKAPGKKTRLKTHKFRSDKDSCRVLISDLHKNYNNKFKWVAELRPDKAHSIAEKIFNNASRSGLEEFELLRRIGSQF